MKKSLFFFTWLFIFAGNKALAQTSSQEETFPQQTDPFLIPKDAVLDVFDILLHHKNKLRIQLNNLADLPKLENMDSIIRDFRENLVHLQDSLSDPLAIKKIDYLTDTAGRNLIRVQQGRPDGNNYLLDHGDLSALKIDQDTIRIIRTFPDFSVGQADKKSVKRFACLTFYLNDYQELYTLDAAGLDSVIARIYGSARKKSRWTPENNHNMKLRASYSLADAEANQPLKILPAYRQNDYLSPNIQGNLQNVYHYLSPSLSLGLKFVFPRKDVNYEIRLNWEPMFLFVKNDQGILQTNRNDWITGEFSLYKTSGDDKNLPFTGNLSLGYLIRNKGNIFDPHTFRLGFGGLKIDKITLEPVIYFHNLFKGVTPGIQFGVGL